MWWLFILYRIEFGSFPGTHKNQTWEKFTLVPTVTNMLLCSQIPVNKTYSKIVSTYQVYSGGSQYWYVHYTGCTPFLYYIYKANVQRNIATTGEIICACRVTLSIDNDVESDICIFCMMISIECEWRQVMLSSEDSRMLASVHSIIQ